METIRALHIIDSLSLGGAERMAVNLTNALAQQGVDTFLCVSRDDGPLREKLSPDVHLFFLGKQGKMDAAAVWRLRNYIRRNKINVVHAHSSSVYVAVVVRALTGFKLVWHDHYGDSERLDRRPSKILRGIAPFIDSIFAVNGLLKDWSIGVLNKRREQVEYLPNFATIDGSDRLISTLPFNPNDLKIVCLANLRAAKDHLFLLKAMESVEAQYSLYLVGNDTGDQYSKTIHEYIREHKLHNVYVLGGRSDATAILKSCDIGVLSSYSEGLSVSLLEYGLVGLPVVCTRVGECPTVLQNGELGLLVDSGDVEGLSAALQTLINDPALRAAYGKKFQEHVTNFYSKDAIIARVIHQYNKLIHE